jgi:hypothetical protein
MRRGWQKVATNYKMTVFVFRYTETTPSQPATPGSVGAESYFETKYMAVTNKAQGVGTLFETIEPEVPPDPAGNAREHGLGENEPANMATPEGCGTKL